MTQQDVNLFTDMSGNLMVSRIQSFLLWRKLKIKEPKYGQDGLCVLCGGNRIVNLRGHGIARCICDIVEEGRRLERINRELRSNVINADLDDLKSVEHQRWLRETMSGLKTWIDWPSHWITIVGGVGSGKTHILSAIADSFGSFALYITESDFESKLSSFMDQREDNLTMSDYMERLKYVPILVYDDAGSGYKGKAESFARAKLHNIIDFRYMMYDEYITVVSTNLSRGELQAWNMRVADRIMDTSLVNGIPRVWVINNPMPSHRRQANANSNF
jgi:DNA replication protein DnaC